MIPIICEELRREYPGDSAWKSYVEALEVASDCSSGEELRAVVEYKLGNNKKRTIAWFEKNIPALDNKSPSQVLKERDGIKILRTFVMRLP